MNNLLLLLVLFPTFSWATLPAGVPKTTPVHANCFLDGEIEAKKDKLARVSVSGCKSPIVKPTDVIHAHVVYAAGSVSIYDCEAARKDTFDRLLLQTAIGDLVKVSNSLQNDPDNEDKNLCALNTIYEWAKADGYSKIDADSELQARNVRAWNMADFAAVYIRLLGVQQLAKTQGKESKILKWFTDRADQISKSKHDHRQNIYYWTGYALMNLGFATEQSSYVKEGKAIFDDAIGDIQTSSSDAKDRGWLPAELLRLNRAYGYHFFAVQPLLGMIGISKAYNCNFLESSQETKLSYLIAKIVEGTLDPKVFEKKTGYKQTDPPAALDDHLPLLGDDDQAMDILSKVSDIIQSYNSKMTLAIEKPANTTHLGGRVDGIPAPGSIAIKNSSLKSFCNIP